MLIPTPKYFIHNCSDNAKHQCCQKYNVQSWLWSAKRAFPQLTSSVLAKQEKPERMKALCALTLGFLNLYQTDAMKKNLETKQNFCLLNAQAQVSLPWQLAQAATQIGSAAPTPRSTIHTQWAICFQMPKTLHQVGWLVHSLSTGCLKKMSVLPESNNLTKTVIAYCFWRGKEKLNTLNALETHPFVRALKERM